MHGADDKSLRRWCLWNVVFKWQISIFLLRFCLLVKSSRRRKRLTLLYPSYILCCDVSSQKSVIAPQEMGVIKSLVLGKIAFFSISWQDQRKLPIRCQIQARFQRSRALSPSSRVYCLYRSIRVSLQRCSTLLSHPEWAFLDSSNNHEAVFARIFLCIMNA